MKNLSVVLMAAALGLSLGVSAQPAAAKTTHHHAQSSRSHRITEHDRVRTAQWDLDLLGYKPGKADGVLGRHTRAAIQAFQIDHQLPATGTLTPVTYSRIVSEAMDALEHGRAGVHGAALAPIPPAKGVSRFGNLSVSETKGDFARDDVVLLNDRPVFHAAHQPSPVDLSPTFNLGGADVVIVTSYSGDSLCPFKHHILIITENTANASQEIPNCTRNYQARADQGNLFVAFPANAEQPVGATYRYQGGTLERL